MENLVIPDAAFWSGKKVLVFGHTGFKGSWLSLWLHQLGARVSGFALPPPTSPSLFDSASLVDLVDSHIGDIRDLDSVRAVCAQIQPDIVLHLAAQPLVRKSYNIPVETFETNVMGTVHVLEACRSTPSIAAALIVSSDKCYENREWHWAYRECEAMGGFDPYSASKGCAELVTAAYRRSYFSEGGSRSLWLASGRAGNVIGGGDWAEDRLIPDCIRALRAGREIEIRNPLATRPWQHVLDPLSGYLLLVERMAQDQNEIYTEGWNFGPPDEGAKPVSWIADRIVDGWGMGGTWSQTSFDQPHEARYLKVDPSKARAHLGWRCRLNIDEAIDWTVDWYRQHHNGADARQLCEAQIALYCKSTDTQI